MYANISKKIFIWKKKKTVNSNTPAKAYSFTIKSHTDPALNTKFSL